MADKTGDVMFTIDKGGAGEKDYNYMLAIRDNQKQWYVEQRVLQPPSLILTEIHMTVLAAPEMTQANGVPISTRTISTVLGELRTIADTATVIVLDGLDDEIYNVMLDPRATKTTSVKDESGRVTQYEIAISCWDMKQA